MTTLCFQIRKRENSLVRLDLHVHTEYSHDCAAPVRSVLDRCRQTGLELVAITDHNNIRGALEAREVADFPVIVGEEVKSFHGDIIGLFLEEAVPARLSPGEPVARIKAQGGLVGVPHPFDRVRPTALGRKALLEILTDVDFLEGYNGHTLLPMDNKMGMYFADEHSLPLVASSDSHSALELGRTYTDVPDDVWDGTPQGLLRAIRAGHWTGRRPNPFLMLAPGYATLRKVLSRGC